MVDTRAADDFFGATVDFLWGFVGVALVAYPVVWSLAEVLEAPTPIPGLVTAAVATVGAYPFVVRRWSLGRLHEYVLAYVGSILVLGLAGAALVATADLAIAGDNRLPQLVVFVLAHGTAVLTITWLHGGGRAGATRASQ